MTLAFRPVDPIEDVLGRLAQYRRTAFRVASDFEADLCEWFGLNAGQARLLAVLYRSPVPVTKDALMLATDIHGRTFHFYLTDIRQAMGEGCLPPCDRDTGGYQLTQAGRAACDEAVARVGIGYLRGRLAA